MPNTVLRQAALCLESKWNVHCSDTHILCTRVAKGLWKRQLLLCTLLSNTVAHGTCFLCQAHTFKLCSCSKYIWSLWNSNHKNTRKPLNWVPINYIFRNKAPGLACGMPWLPVGSCAPASAQPSQGTDPAEPVSHCWGAHHQIFPSAALQAGEKASQLLPKTQK